MSAPRFHLDNLTAIVDFNGWQSCDSVENTMPLEPLVDKWTAFGWNTVKIDGHNMAEIVSALYSATRFEGKPTVIIARTIKGKGVSFMEDDNSWHQKAPTKEQFDIALTELGGKSS